ncbi:MAG: hypothetical protein RLZZ631_1494 [Cyanobacteriota bacterium]|jgi:hypothetical protein
MTHPHAHHALLLPLLLAATTAAAAPAQAEPLSFQEQRALMRQMTQRLQDRLDQRLRCIDKATKLTELQACQRSTGMGDHGWGCPMCPMW